MKLTALLLLLEINELLQHTLSKYKLDDISEDEFTVRHFDTGILTKIVKHTFFI